MQNLEGIIKKSLRQSAFILRRKPDCPSELELSRYLEGTLPSDRRQTLEKHFSDCPLCLDLLVTTKNILKEEKAAKKSLLSYLLKQKWLILTAACFGLSFVVKRFFLQFLFLALIFGIKWALGGEGSRNLVMIFRSLSHKDAEIRKPQEKIFERK
ncbi:hypothetical protein EPN16_04255 [bacterium]|nr:MAG: hypothetical protein EPN16_04255 [bacterium]